MNELQKKYLKKGVEFVFISVDKNVFVIGGRDGLFVQYLNTTQLYNTSSGEWSQKSQLEYGHGCAINGRKSAAPAGESNSFRADGRIWAISG